MGAVDEAEDVVVKDEEEQNELDTTTAMMRDTAMVVIMTRDTVMMMVTVTEDTMDMEAAGAVFGAVEAAADLVDEVAVVAVVPPLPRKVEREPTPGRQRPPMHRMRPTIHLRWSRRRTAVVAMEGEAVLDADGVAVDAEEEELMLSV